MPRQRSAFTPLVCLAFVLLPTSSLSAQTLVNASFEEPRNTPGTADFTLVDESLVPGWKTTASDDLIEFWSDDFIFTSYDLDQHVELNATEDSTLFQDLSGVAAGSTATFRFAHRGRSGVDTLELTITDLGADDMLGGGDDTVLFTSQYSTDNTGWAVYTSEGETPIVAVGNTIRLAFTAVSAAGGNPRLGNLLDSVEFGIGVLATPTADVPALGPWGMAVLVCLLGLASVFVMRRQRPNA